MLQEFQRRRREKRLREKTALVACPAPQPALVPSPALDELGKKETKVQIPELGVIFRNYSVVR